MRPDHSRHQPFSLTLSPWIVLSLAAASVLFGGSLSYPEEPPAAPADTGSIAGQLVDAHDMSLKSGHAVVILCDAATGYPLSPKTYQTIDNRTGEFPAGDWLYAVTAADGGFHFDAVPAGTYRLVAQSWAGVAGMPVAIPGNDENAKSEPSSTVILHGVADNVVVKPGERTLAYPRQQGDAVVTIVTDPAEPHNFLLFSAKPPLGEGVLGPIGWGPNFIAGAIGFTRMEDSHVTILGLAKGATIHVGLFNYDDSVGTGGTSFEVQPGQTVTLPIYAGWSNGKYEPTERLAKLTDHLETAKVNVSELLKFDMKGGPDNFGQYIQTAWKHAGDMIDVPGYGQVKFIDLLAADYYRRGREHHRPKK